MRRLIAPALLLAVFLAAPTSSLALTTTEIEIEGSVTSQITGLTFGPDGTYSKPGFPLLLPATSTSGALLLHNGGSFTFGSDASLNTYRYAGWSYLRLSTCGAGDLCEVLVFDGTNVIAPFELINVDPTAGTGDLVFTALGAQQWSDLATGPVLSAGQEGFSDVFSTGQLFATTTFVPEPSTAALTALGLIGLASRRRRP